MKAIVVGAGIGGLCAALCLHKYGWEVEILEQSPVLSNVGAGIQVSPNGVKVLRAIGVEDAVSRYAFVPSHAEFRGGYSGNVIAKVQMGDDMVSRHGAPYWHIHRADLIAVLSDAVHTRMPSAIKTNMRVTGYDQDKSNASVTLENGDVISGDIIIGADGIKSIIRTQMHGGDSARFTGNVAWRATVPMSKLGRHIPPPTACVWVGDGKHAVTYRLRDGDVANFVGVVERDDWMEEGWSEQGTKAQAMRDFAGWHPTIRKIIDAADTHYRWALFDRLPLENWHDDRVALLGDACHPMLPFMAQGGVMAMEDAYVLAKQISDKSNIGEAYNSYYTLRKNRTAKVQGQAQKNMELFHSSGVKDKLKRFVPLWLGGKMAPQLIDEHYDWIYGHDVTLM